MTAFELLSIILASDHPLVEQFLPQVAAKMGKTVEEAKALLRQAAEAEGEM